MPRRRRRRFTLGRAFALLLLGIGIGAALYLSRHLRPDSLRQDVRAALEKIIVARHELRDVEIGLDTGVEVTGLKVFYEDGTPAVEVERIALTVDHKKLLRGKVEIRQVDFYGMVLRLKRNEAGEPSLPGIFRQSESAPDQPFTLPEGMPPIQIHPGDGGSWLEFVNPRPLREGVPLRLRCVRAEARLDGPRFIVTAEFAAKRLDRLDVDLVLDPAAQTLRVRAKAKRLHWARSDIDMLNPTLRERLPPVELGGEADVEMTAILGFPALETRSVSVRARLARLEGVFGNVYTGEPVGLPFGLREGSGELRYKDGRIDLDGFRSVYVSPVGTHGRIEASVAVALDRPGPYLDLAIRGRDFQGSTDDLRHLLPPDVVEGMVEKFLPGGTFNFDVTVSQRPALLEKVVAELIFTDGRLDYAGNLDELTGRRFGFRYPLERCRGRVRVETHVATARGLAQVIEIENLRGFNPIARPRPDGPKDVAIRADGRVLLYQLPDGVNREDIDILVRIDDLPIDAKLARAFASTAEGSPYAAFDLTGWAKQVEIRVQRDGFAEREARAGYDVTLENCSLALKEFPLRVLDIEGRIVSRDLPPDALGRRGRRLEIHGIRGRAREGGSFSASGEVTQFDDDTEEVDLTVIAERISIGNDLERALLASSAAGTGFVDVWRKVRPSGSVSAVLRMESARQLQMDIDLSDLALGGYEEIDFPITELDGLIRYAAGIVTLENVTGRIFDQATFHVGGAIERDGAFELKGEVDQLVLRTAVQRILDVFAPEASAAIAALELDPDSAFDVVLECTRAQADAPLRFSCTLDNLDVKSRVFGLELSVRGGPISLGLDAIRARDVWLRAGDGQIRVLDANVPYDPGVPRWVLVDARNLEPLGHLERILGPGVREVLGRNLRVELNGFRVEYDPGEATVILSGAIDLHRYEILEREEGALEPTGQVGFSPLTIRLPRAANDPLSFFGVVDFNHINLNLPVNVKGLSGQVRVAEGTLAPEFTIRGSVSDGGARVFERLMTGMSFNLTYDPRRLRLGNIDGRFYEGAFKGDVEVHLIDPGAFRVRLRAEDVELGEMLKEDLPRSEPMFGTLEMVVDLESPSSKPEHMQGMAQVRVENGKLFRVPGLRRILSVLSRVTPLSDKRFERAEAEFVIEGEEIVVRRFHFSTDLNDVRGFGSISIYGDLDLVVEPQVTRAIDLPRLVNIPVLSSLLNIWHSTVYEIRLEGTLDSPALRLRALPFIKKKRQRFTQSPHAGRAERIRPRLLP